MYETEWKKENFLALYSAKNVCPCGIVKVPRVIVVRFDKQVLLCGKAGTVACTNVIRFYPSFGHGDRIRHVVLLFWTSWFTTSVFFFNWLKRNITSHHQNGKCEWAKDLNKKCKKSKMSPASNHPKGNRWHTFLWTSSSNTSQYRNDETQVQ